jgi:hypothetical protein
MAVVALGMMSDIHIEVSMSNARTAQTGRPSAASTMTPAISAVPPLASRACPTGIMAPSRISTGHSIPV